MNLHNNTPLGSLLDGLLRGEVDLHEEELRAYFENLINKDEMLRNNALQEVETAIKKWHNSYFISTYKQRIKECEQGKQLWSQQELDDLFYEEEYLINDSKIALTVDYLYDAIAKCGFINGHQRNAIESAWANDDIEFMQSVWEDLVLRQIRSVQTIISSIHTSCNDISLNDLHDLYRPQKSVEDYPEVFDINTCSELTGYAKSTLYKLTSTSKIPCCRAGSNGRKLTFKRNDVIDWMTAQQQEAEYEYINRMNAELAS